MLTAGSHKIVDGNNMEIIIVAITDMRMEELNREVREHNNCARRVPVVEEQIKVINHRLEDLEHDSGE